MRGRNRVSVCAAAVAAAMVWNATAVADSHEAEKPGAPPGPSAEHKKLQFFVGKWTGEAEMKEGSFGPGGKFTSTDTCEWFEGNYTVVCHTSGKSPMGAMKGIGILGYSAEEGVYTYYGVDNSPRVMTTVPRGRIEGDTWTYTDESKMMGKTIKSRYIIKETSPSSYTFRWEVLGEDGAWAQVMEGTQKRK